MFLAVWARFFKVEWCRNHIEIWSGDRFLNILGCDNLLLLVNYLFRANYSERLRQPYVNLRYRVHLKHHNKIHKLKKKNKKMSGSRLFYSLFPGLKFEGKQASGMCQND